MTTHQTNLSNAKITYAGWHGKLIVSCQAAPGSPLDNPETLAAIAQTVVAGGAVGIRANHGRNIAAIREAVAVPIIGLKKRDVEGYAVYITPEWRDVMEVYNAGANIIALDATLRPRPGHQNFATLCQRIHDELPGILVMADIATFDEGIAAAAEGADFVGTTMNGYTMESTDADKSGPNIKLVEELACALPSTPIICEGRVQRPEQAKLAIQAGAFSVVVGSAITAPQWIATQYVNSLRSSSLSGQA